MSVVHHELGPVQGHELDLVRHFLFTEADLLDTREFSAWLELFTEDCLYWVPCGPPDQDPRIGPALIFDDHGRLEERVQRLRNGESFCQTPPSLIHHVVGGVVAHRTERSAALIDYPLPASLVERLLAPGGPVTVVRSKQLVTELHHGRQTTFAATCTHVLTTTEHGTTSVVLKKMDLLNAGEPVVDLSFLL